MTITGPSRALRLAADRLDGLDVDLYVTVSPSYITVQVSGPGPWPDRLALAASVAERFHLDGPGVRGAYEGTGPSAGSWRWEGSDAGIDVEVYAPYGWDEVAEVDATAEAVAV